MREKGRKGETLHKTQTEAPGECASDAVGEKATIQGAVAKDVLGGTFNFLF